MSNTKNQRCVFNNECKGNKKKGKYSSFPLFSNLKQNNKCCRKCLYIVIKARDQYIKEYRLSKEVIPINGCAYCGGNAFSVSYGEDSSGKIVMKESKYNEYCCIMCAYNDSHHRSLVI